jgi:hypothetical protein
MDSATRKSLADTIRTLVALLKSDKEPEKKKPVKPMAPPPPPQEPTELQRVQRHFEFLREHGGILAEGRVHPYSGEFEWKYPPRW